MLGYSDGSQEEEELEFGEKLGKSNETWKHRGLVRCVVFLRAGDSSRNWGSHGVSC